MPIAPRSKPIQRITSTITGLAVDAAKCAAEINMLFVFGFVFGLVMLAFVALVPFFVLLITGEFVLKAIPYGRALRFLLLMFKNLRRNLLRTS